MGKNHLSAKQIIVLSLLLGANTFAIAQSEAPAKKQEPPYFRVVNTENLRNGSAETFTVSVSTNISDWLLLPQKASDEWCSVERIDDDAIEVTVTRNDKMKERTAYFAVYAAGIIDSFSVTQPNRGYAGLYHDYYRSLGDNWQVNWIGVDVHGLTTIGNNFAVLAVQWQSAEADLLNFNLEYLDHTTLTLNWEPMLRGYLPITRDGRWAGYAGVGAHVAMMKSGMGEQQRYRHNVCLELGTMIRWNARLSSRIFAKYNNYVTLGLSFEFGDRF